MTEHQKWLYPSNDGKPQTHFSILNSWSLMISSLFMKFAQPTISTKWAFGYRHVFSDGPIYPSA
jgi:hypothetical protein